MNRETGGFFLQSDPRLNERPAWTAQEFPQARYHYFKESGCVVTSLWNMCHAYQVPDFESHYPTPWELNEACKAQGAFYPNANIEMGLLDKVVPVRYLDRYSFDEAALREELVRGTLCLLRAKGQNSRYHYVLPLLTDEGALRCFDPKLGATELGGYEELYQIIRFRGFW